MKSIKISFGDLDTGVNYGLFLRDGDTKTLDVSKISKDTKLHYLNAKLFAVSVDEGETSANYFAQNLKKFRKERNLTQRELAEKSGVRKNTIYCYEDGRTIPTIYNVQLLADALKIPITKLFYSV